MISWNNFYNQNSCLLLNLASYNYCCLIYNSDLILKGKIITFIIKGVLFTLIRIGGISIYFMQFNFILYIL